MTFFGVFDLWILKTVLAAAAIICVIGFLGWIVTRNELKLEAARKRPLYKVELFDGQSWTGSFDVEHECNMQQRGYRTTFALGGKQYRLVVNDERRA
jgi:hypothetical protein